jgi:outer membrane receptor protein involved in Fe transport
VTLTQLTLLLSIDRQFLTKHLVVRIDVIAYAQSARARHPWYMGNIGIDAGGCKGGSCAVGTQHDSDIWNTVQASGRAVAPAGFLGEFMSPFLRASIRSALAGAALSAGVAHADPQAAEAAEIAEVVLVTGSFIRGTPEDAALPVDVISSEDLEKQGMPSTLEMVKSLPVANGIVGESNQFTSGRGQAAQGSASINLRGLGAARTLILLNGKRLPSSDANLLPSSAISRVEVLKDGAAATYGSDAMGGVVNFITRESYRGLDVSADYRYIPDSDGDYNANVTWGAALGERASALLSFNYFHRSPLLVSGRDWALRAYLENPEGGWTAASNCHGHERARRGSVVRAPGAELRSFDRQSARPHLQDRRAQGVLTTTAPAQRRSILGAPSAVLSCQPGSSRSPSGGGNWLQTSRSQLRKCMTFGRSK